MYNLYIHKNTTEFNDVREIFHIHTVNIKDSYDVLYDK